jgi:hypothetical protein
MDWIQGLIDGSLVDGGIFLLIGIAGGVLLLISLLLDGIFDAFDFGDGPLSLTTIAAFTAIFGFTAFALVGSGVDSPLAGTLGALAGVLGGALAWWLSRLIRSAESSTAVSSGELAGLEASVVLEIPGGSGFGEIAFTRHGERVSLSACASDRLPRGTRVRIVDSLTPTSVLVAAVSQAVVTQADVAQASDAQAEVSSADPATTDPTTTTDPTDPQPERN